MSAPVPSVRVGQSAARAVPTGLDWPVSVAPMMRRTDRFCRYFLRQVAPRAALYTEMITADALLRGPRARLLAFDPAERPVVCQLGGSDPRALADAARMVEDAGYDAVNLNVGCPSDRVRAGRFGASLMRAPALVADCVAAMRAAVSIPVTVKHRVGVDGLESYGDMLRFVRTVAAAGCRHFIVHARIAVLGGLSPHENRVVPPLRYDDVFRLKREMPRLHITLNGGIATPAHALEVLPHVDAVMIGRAAWDNPWMLAVLERTLLDGDGADAIGHTRHAVARRMMPWVRAQCAAGAPPRRVLRPMLGLFAGRPGGKRFRRCLGEQMHGPSADAGALDEALAYMDSLTA